MGRGAQGQSLRSYPPLGGDWVVKIQSTKAPSGALNRQASAARAVELAGKAIDKHSNQNASDDERKVRKSKLIQGPSVFRDARKDRPGK